MSWYAIELSDNWRWRKKQREEQREHGGTKPKVMTIMPIYDLWKKTTEKRSWTNCICESRESENGPTGLDCNRELRLGTVDWGMLLQIHNYMRLMSLLKLQQHVARLQARERTSKRPTESEQRSSHNSDSHKPAMLTTARKGHKWLHTHTHTHTLTHTQLKIKPSYFSRHLSHYHHRQRQLPTVQRLRSSPSVPATTF